MGFFNDIAMGLDIALSWNNLLYCLIGVSLGMFVGVLPGLGTLTALSLLFPITFYLDPTAALVMLAGIYYGTAYGGSTAAILLNMPGQASASVTCLDGYPMTQQGRGGVALLITTIASFLGGTMAIILMMVFSPVVVDVGLEFQSPEYFALMLLGLVAASTMSTGSTLTGIAMMLLGIMIGLIGMDVNSGIARFTFGEPRLMEGISIAVIAIGLFGIAEMVSSIGSDASRNMKSHSVSFRSMIPKRDDVRRSVLPLFRGTAVGSFFGALPGAGALISSFMAYALEKRVARNPERFGKGAVEGIVAPEAANNAADQAAFIPTLTLGIPGSAAMAIMIGVLLIHGVTPGPRLMLNHPEMFWGLVMSFWIGNLILLVLNIPLIGIWIKLLKVPYHILFPTIIMFVCVGAYSLGNSAFNVWLIVVFGALGYGMRLLSLPAAPLVLGFVLGPMMEEHLRRSLQLARGDILTFFDRPISAVITTIALAILVWGLGAPILRKVKYRNSKDVKLK